MQYHKEIYEALKAKKLAVAREKMEEHLIEVSTRFSDLAQNQVTIQRKIQKVVKKDLTRFFCENAK